MCVAVHYCSSSVPVVSCTYIFYCATPAHFDNPAFEKLLQEDKDLDERYQLLLTAKQAIRSQGLKQYVQNFHKQYMQEEKPVEKQEAKIIKPFSFFKTFMRVAAVFIIAVFGYGIFEYTTTDNESLYKENFTAMNRL